MEDTGDTEDMDIADELRAIAKDIPQKLRQHTVKVKGGSGVIWHSDGLIITNAHVATSQKTTVQLWDNRIFEAVRIKIDPAKDLAALKVSASDLPAATIGNIDNLRVGELVMAVGSPFGDRTAMTTGIVSQVASSHILADIRLFPGNSGGLLADCYGIVGINSMIAYGWGVAIPTRVVESFLAKDCLWRR